MSERNLERASFLKSRRHRLTPEQVGLPPSSRRRVSTLRREDVAWLADVGITWYTWLEQGRPIKIATDTLDRVAAALQLDVSETEYLRKLVLTNGRERAHWNTPVADGIRALVESYSVGYAFVIGPRWDILSWNGSFAAVFGIDEHADPRSRFARNGMWLMFTHPDSRILFSNWHAVARRMTATFRAEYADYVGDSGFQELIDALNARSPDFVSMWADVDVLSPARWSVGEIRDPSSGRTVSLQTVSLCIPDSPGQTLMFYIPTQVRLPVALPQLRNGQ